MAQLQVSKVDDTLRDEGFTDEQRRKVRTAIVENLPPATYNAAVIFLGLATLALAIGAVVLGGLEKTVPEALWGAVGAGIGGLAGIFMSRE